jgi:hypothetical protein
MDDLKLIAKSEEELKQREIQTSKTFSDDIVWYLDLKNVLSLHLREANSFPRKI